MVHTLHRRGAYENAPHSPSNIHVVKTFGTVSEVR